MIDETFSDEEFLSICGELEEKDVHGWEQFLLSHGVSIFRLYDKKSGLYQYKIFGTMDEVAPETCYQVYLDIDYRPKWDSFVKELRPIIKDCDKRVIYWQVNFPWPMANRDYVYLCQHRVLDPATAGPTFTDPVYVALARICPEYPEPKRHGVVRVPEYRTSCALTSDGKRGTRAYMRYYDNPGGAIPAWLINWAAKTGVPNFLGNMQKACRGYPQYLEKKKKKSAERVT